MTTKELQLYINKNCCVDFVPNPTARIRPVYNEGIFMDSDAAVSERNPRSALSDWFSLEKITIHEKEIVNGITVSFETKAGTVYIYK